MAPALKTKLELDEDTFSRPIEEAAASISRAGGSLASVGAAITGVLTAPLALIAAPAVAAADAQRDASNAIRSSTGATGEALDALVAVYGQVRREARTGIDDASTVVAGLSTTLGLTGDDLRAASVAVVKLSMATGTDPKTAATAIARTMSAWGVAGGDVAGAVAGLEVAARTCEGGLSGLAQNLTAAAPTLRTAGLTMGESTAMLADLASYGVPAGDALTGLQKALTKLASEGAPDAGKALRQIIESIRSATTAEDASRIAVDAFGKRGVGMADAITRGALSEESLRKVGSSIPGAGPVLTLSRAFDELRIIIEQAIEPLGAAIQRLAVPALRAGARVLGVMIDLAAGITRAFARLPDWAQKTIVVVAGVAALIGPALAFVGAVVAPLSGLVLTGMSTIGSTGLIAGALGTLATGGLVAMARNGDDLAAAMQGAAAAGVVGAVTLAGAAVATSAETAVRKSDDVTSTIVGKMAPLAGSVTRPSPQSSVEFPRFRPPVGPGFTVAPIPVQTITGLAIPQVELPSVGAMPWNQAYDWLRQFAEKVSAGSGVPTAREPIHVPQYQDLRGITGGAITGASDEEIIARLKDIGRLKGVKYQTSFGKDMDPKDARAMLEAQLAAALKTMTLGDSMRLHAWAMEPFYDRIRQPDIGIIGPVMPGSWLDGNTPEAWMARATETDRLVQLQKERTDFFAGQRQANDSFWINKWHGDQLALKSAFAKPQVYIAEDVFRAVQQGWQQATGSWSGGSIGGSGAGPEYPQPAAPTTTNAPPVGTRARETFDAAQKASKDPRPTPTRAPDRKLPRSEPSIKDLIRVAKEAHARRLADFLGQAPAASKPVGGTDPRLADARYMARLRERGMTLNDVRPGDFADWTTPINGGRPRSAEEQRWLDSTDPSARGVQAPSAPAASAKGVTGKMTGGGIPSAKASFVPVKR